MLENSIILEHGPGGDWVCFEGAARYVAAWDVGEVAGALEAVEAAVRGGQWAAGYVGYEAAGGLDAAFVTREGRAGEPLLWFGIYERPRAWSLDEAGDGAFEFEAWRARVDEAEYRAAIAAVRERIAAGDTYQVNFSYMLESQFRGDAEAMFAALWRAQRGGYGALLRAEGRTIASFSPELFFEQRGERIVTRPMKGTRRRGRWEAEDAAAGAALAASAKDRAENVMIVDLLRNDVGRIARTGSVEVERLFAVARYPTLWQMTSTVRARADAAGGGAMRTLRALFPCGSITGAPKIKTMEIIAGLEQQARGVYTGAIGWFGPDAGEGERAAFSVAIRTIEIEADGRARYGVGGGVTWGSTAEGEWAETQTKALLLLAHREEPFELLETLRWRRGEGFWLLERHLARMESSARYFGFVFDRDAMHAELERIAHDLVLRSEAELWRVRLTLDAEGGMGSEATAIQTAEAGVCWRLGVVGEAGLRVDSRDVFLFHKTTRRGGYDRARAARAGCDEVILVNERGEVTEGSFTNLVVEIGGKKWTPARECGLLAGTLREELIARGEIAERVLTVEDLRGAERVWVVNSVRGWVEGEIDE